MKIIPRMLVVATLALWSACAKPDWIQQTLVTADVTGTWAGSMGTGNTFGEILLELEQTGPKVKGQLRKVGAGGGTSQLIGGPLEGIVHGEMFTFSLPNAKGETSVSEDEMKGSITMHGNQPIFLRRTSSSPPRPATQP